MEAILHAKMLAMIVSPLCKEVSKQANKKSPPCFRITETKAHLDSATLTLSMDAWRTKITTWQLPKPKCFTKPKK